ncbi:MAG TPA: hypothetical protein VFN30_03650 [Chitinophagaceae bacterium]|nr:hypothetical protein [Chitinophagaceae bacterium]
MYKKILLSLFCSILFISLLEAQISKNSLLLGGSVGFNSNNSEGYNNIKSSQKNFYINPAAGIAVRTNLILGGELSYSYSKSSTAYATVEKTNTYGAGIFLRKYLPVSGKFYFFGQAHAGANLLKIKNEGLPNYFMVTQKGWGINFGVVPGISFAINKRLHLESGFNNIFFANYQQLKREDITIGGITKSKTNSFSIGSNISNFSSSLFFGFRVLLAK